jgi:hypothetical protein
MVRIKGMLRGERGAETALAYVQGRLIEAGEAVERRLRKRGAGVLECERRGDLVAALRAMRDEIEATIKGLEEQP